MPSLPHLLEEVEQHQPVQSRPLLRPLSTNFLKISLRSCWSIHTFFLSKKWVEEMKTWGSKNLFGNGSKKICLFKVKAWNPLLIEVIFQEVLRELEDTFHHVSISKSDRMQLWRWKFEDYFHITADEAMKVRI